MGSSRRSFGVMAEGWARCGRGAVEGLAAALFRREPADVAAGSANGGVNAPLSAPRPRWSERRGADAAIVDGGDVNILGAAVLLRPRNLESARSQPQACWRRARGPATAPKNPPRLTCRW